MKTLQIQKQLNQLFAMSSVEGNITITVKVDTNSFKVMDEQAEKNISQLVAPLNAIQDGHVFYKKGLTVTIFHEIA